MRAVEATQPTILHPSATPTRLPSPDAKPVARKRPRPRQAGSADDALNVLATQGWIIITLFFGVLGSWSLLAPLNGAVVASGFVKVEGNRKSLQHHEGGTVRQIKVREGDHVAAGQVLLTLDDTQVRAEYDILDQQALDLRAAEARMQAELALLDKIAFPPDLTAMAKQPHVASILAGQVQQFEFRRTALEGQRRIISEKIAQLESQIAGAGSQIASNTSQRNSIRREAESLAPLVERGVIARPRLLQLERSASAFDGQIGELDGSIARNRQAIAEQRQVANQLDRERASDISKDLQATQARLAEVAPRLSSVKQQVARMEVRAPYAGRVVGLAVFSTGGVVGSGEKILDIVPDQETLIVEAQIGVEDIADIRPGARAEVRLIAYKNRSTPTIAGQVTQVSADRLLDNRSGSPYFLAQIRIADGELAALPEIKLYPGMPTSVMIPTVERSAFDYLVGPLLSSFDHAFRQK